MAKVIYFGFQDKKELSESIAKKLNDPKTTLEDLLIEGDLLEDLENKYDNLINFFNKEKVIQMLNYIIKEQEGDDILKGHKFPFICSQIFKLKIENIMKYFFMTKNEMRKLENKDNIKIKKDEAISELDTTEDNQSENNEPKPENKLELIDYLFNNFFPEDKSVKLNYVLCGYFSSLINDLLQINPSVFLEYIYLYRYKFLEKMAFHSYRKLMSDILSKLLHFEKYHKFEKKTTKEINPKRLLILSYIFSKINIDSDNEDINSIYDLVTRLIDVTKIEEEKQLFEGIIKEKTIIESIITTPFKNLNLVNINSNNNNEEHYILLNRRKNFSTLINIICFFLKNIIKLKLKLPSNDLKSTENDIILIGAALSDILKPLLENNFVKKNENEESQLQSYNDYYSMPLGEYKIKIIDLLTILIPYFKNVSKFFDTILIEVDFFKTAFEFLLQHEWNNIYQRSLYKLLKYLFCTADNHKILINHLIEKIKIFDIIREHTTLKNIEKFNFIDINNNALGEQERESLPINRGYYPFFISLAHKLNFVMGGKKVKIDGIKDYFKRKGSFQYLDISWFEIIDERVNDDEYSFKRMKENLKEIEIKFSYKCMKKFMNDNWRKFFESNIEKIIKQYEYKIDPNGKQPLSMNQEFNNDNDKEEIEKDNEENNRGEKKEEEPLLMNKKINNDNNKEEIKKDNEENNKGEKKELNKEQNNTIQNNKKDKCCPCCHCF